MHKGFLTVDAARRLREESRKTEDRRRKLAESFLSGRRGDQRNRTAAEPAPSPGVLAQLVAENW